MWEIWANWLLPKSLKTCRKSNKSPNLVTLTNIQVKTLVILKQNTLKIIVFHNGLAFCVIFKRVKKPRKVLIPSLPFHDYKGLRRTGTTPLGSRRWSGPTGWPTPPSSIYQTIGFGSFPATSASLSSSWWPIFWRRTRWQRSSHCHRSGTIWCRWRRRSTRRSSVCVRSTWCRTRTIKRTLKLPRTCMLVTAKFRNPFF